MIGSACNAYRVANAARTALGLLQRSSSGALLAGQRNTIGLRTLVALDDLEMHLVAFFERLVPVPLNGAVVNEYIRPVIPAEKAVPLGIIEPAHDTMKLSHVIYPLASGLITYGNPITIQLRFGPRQRQSGA
jgi:hypothetical protein